MSSDPCACQCKTMETAPQSHAVFLETRVPSFDFGFDAIYAPVPAPDGSFGLCLALMTAVVPLTLARQKRNSWCVLSLGGPDRSLDRQARVSRVWRSKRLRLDRARWARAAAC